MISRRTKLSETYEVARPPAPVTMAKAFQIDRDELAFHRRSGTLDGYVKRVKHLIAMKLAEEIVKNTQILSDEDILSGNETVMVEVTFNDRGTYENWLPCERRAGRREGFKQATEALPYGMAPHEQEPV